LTAKSANISVASVTNSVAGAGTLTLNGAHHGQRGHRGNITNGSGTIAVTESGTGIWTLQGAGNYSGATLVAVVP